MEKIHNFLKEAGTFIVTTVDGDQPKARPFGYQALEDGKVLFGVGDYKDCYKQLQANPKVEILAVKPDMTWLRYTGTAVFETDPKYAEHALETMPELKAIYTPESGKKMAMFHLENAHAVIIKVMNVVETLL